jgi:unsaturated rhamnogalacturonyl hydrolase
MRTVKLIFVPTHLYLIFYLFFACDAILIAQTNQETIKKLKAVADAILKDASYQFENESTSEKYSSAKEIPSGVKVKIKSPFNDWRYWNGVLNIAMLKLADVQNEPAYKEYTKKNIAFAFDNYEWFEANHKSESKWNYPFGQRFITQELDDCGAMGASLIEVYKEDQLVRYRDYINLAANHILKIQARLKDKTFVRTSPNKWTLWADDLYMGLSFLSRMGELTGNKKYFDDAALQVVNFHKYLFDETFGLMHHFWYSDLNLCGNAFWGRANGWAMLAQVELLDRLPQNHPKRKILIELLQKHILGIARYQSEKGLWHQLLDKVDSYLETSCSAMFTYTIARAINKGYLDKRYTSIALRGWEGVMTKIRDDGLVEGICAGTGTSDDLIHYYTRPTPLNDIHGLGAVILAGSEILRLLN